ncbi:helix-turn-helix transcriptional regulator [Sandarakinorhabdus oryzae]|uniref:helix-turn-helix transcriptional regulator n=1 Tax=Sandarakinorhabdus oryzae TaxID=2675220 RepID=UPI0018CC716A|nr:helix-turn-helix transcriptional regulator [Sandarakinorhabdus oryzae]
MNAMDHQRSAFSGLNPRELEVLQLLAAGHTTKTIATVLGSTETAINERLRAARRKTGIGSSRELARLLEAQKIWDRKIDLSPPGDATNTQPQPAQAGRTWSKGTILMALALPVTAIALVMAMATASPPAAAPVAAQSITRASPLVGSWALDVSRIPAEERPGRVTITFRKAPDGKWTTLVEIVAPDGSTRHAESTAATDGAPVPISGTMDFIDTVALRQPAPGTLVMTLGKNGSPVSTRVYTVAKDRKSMTETIVWAGGDLPNLETTYFTRID